MRHQFYILLAIILGAPGIEAAPKGQISRDLRENRAMLRGLTEEAEDVRLSVQSIEKLHDRLRTELIDFEAEFRERLHGIAVPLLNWPSYPQSRKGLRWVETQRLNFLVHHLRKRIVNEPLFLMSERERRLAEVEGLQANLKQELEQLELKKELLELREEELSLMRKSSVRSQSLSHAQASKKLEMSDEMRAQQP